MIKKKFRLKKSSHIEQVFKKGESLKGSLLICKYKPNNESNHRACFTIAKRFKLTKPEKNRLKRQLTDSYQEVFFTLALEEPSVKPPKFTETQANYSDSSEIFYDFVFILYKLPFADTSRFKQFTLNFKKFKNKLDTLNISQ